jgi:hypothetical protein
MPDSCEDSLTLGEMVELARKRRVKATSGKRSAIDKVVKAQDDFETNPRSGALKELLSKAIDNLATAERRERVMIERCNNPLHNKRLSDRGKLCSGSRLCVA